jgi:hypothetical protein
MHELVAYRYRALLPSAGRVVVSDLFVRPAHDGISDVAPGCHAYNFKEAGGVCLIHMSSATPCDSPGVIRRLPPIPHQSTHALTWPGLVCGPRT